MAQYSYRARNNNGELIRGRTAAADRESAEKGLELSGLIPISVTEIGWEFDWNGEIEKLKARLAVFGRVGTADLIVFTRQLGTMYGAGIPFVRVITSLTEQTENKTLKNALRTIKEHVEGGGSFSSGLSRFPGIFDELYVSMVQAGEAGGVMDEILERLAVLLEKDSEIKAKIKSATLYPKIVILTIVAASFVLITFVIPKFTQFYGKFGVDLPLPTRMLMATSVFFKSYWYIVLIIIISLSLSLKFYIKTPHGRRKWDTLKLSVPIFGPLALKASMSRFAMILGTLLRTGLPILMSLEISSRTIGNVVLSEEVERIRNQIREGRNVRDTFEESGTFPVMMTQMIAAGEETGRLDDMLSKVSSHLSLEVDYTLRNLSTLIEPILLLFIFGLVLFLALSLFMPMWDMVKLVKTK